MTDRQYFQGLAETSKDPMMQAFYAAKLKSLSLRAAAHCGHHIRLPYFERSYGILYAWETCQNCGTELNSRRLDELA